jgi:hypothetical protein
MLVFVLMRRLCCFIETMLRISNSMKTVSSVYQVPSHTISVFKFYANGWEKACSHKYVVGNDIKYFSNLGASSGHSYAHITKSLTRCVGIKDVSPETSTILFVYPSLAIKAFIHFTLTPNPPTWIKKRKLLRSSHSTCPEWYVIFF